MNRITDLDLVRNNAGLIAFAQQCRSQMSIRWPEVDFDAEEWPLHTTYGTYMLDVKFNATISDFKGAADDSYMTACRCLVAIAALEGKTKLPKFIIKSWRLLRYQEVPLGALCRRNLTHIEEQLLKGATPTSAQQNSMCLSKLSSMIDYLSRKGIINYLAWDMSATTKAELAKLTKEGRNIFKAKKNIEVLDRMIEGLSDATRAMLMHDKRLSAPDRSVIAVTNIFMCAPSRINEPLCMGVSDRYVIDHYAERPEGDDSGRVYNVHQLLLMKGSKGAAWSGKPILNFMLKLSSSCWDIILELGQRSRTLLTHYEKIPNTLYLTDELKHLRGNAISINDLWKITSLTNSEPSARERTGIRTGVWSTILKSINGGPGLELAPGYFEPGKNNCNVVAVSWKCIEAYLLERVRIRMEAMRWVTKEVRYSGLLSNMLMLVDSNRTPYLPQAWNSRTVRARLKTTPALREQNQEESVFKKLGLQMSVDGKLVDCYLEPHDPRRWLTTKALDARDRLSDVLINKWANRLDIGQLDAYDLRNPVQKAEQTSLAVPNELESITRGIEDLAIIEDQYGLLTEIVVAHGDGLAITGIEAVIQATEDRPVARSSNQILILYPNRYGICIHQHHEVPCRSYACAEGCNELLAVKGHLPTNEQWRKQDELNNRGIVNQLENLLIARERGLADNPTTLDEHILTLVKGINAQSMATDLIARFPEIASLVRDVHFRNELEAAFVSRGVILRLDDTAVPNGALIKYHNPSKNASPGQNRALETQFGGRDKIQQLDEDFYKKYPELAPKSLGLKDERSLLVDDDYLNDEGVQDDEAA